MKPTRLSLLILFTALFLVLFKAPFALKRNPPSGDWMDRRIALDFARFEKKGISLEMLEKSWANSKNKPEFRRYKIIDSKVYGPPSLIKIFLERLVKTHPVPDVDFLYWNEDRLKKDFFRRTAHRDSVPVFVSAKEKTLDRVILFCEWNYNIEDEQDGWNFLIRKMQEPQVPWSEKIDKVFWRGTPWDGKHFEMYTFDNWTTIPRGQLVYQSLQEPKWIDARFSEYPYKCRVQDLERCMQEMGQLSRIPWDEVLKHKYQIIVDGVTCTFPAAQWKLLSGCLTFKQDSKDIQFFYDELVPWKHYIPVRNDLSDLQKKIRWAQEHDLESKEIAENAREFAMTHLLPEHILLYCHKALVKYASLQRFTPTVD